MDFDGRFAYSDEIEVEYSGPAVFALGSNYPNPFNPTTTFSYSLDKDGYVKIAVYDMLGQQAALLLSENKEAGTHQITFNASSLPSGTYFYRIESGSKTLVKKDAFSKISPYLYPEEAPPSSGINSPGGTTGS